MHYYASPEADGVPVYNNQAAPGPFAWSEAAPESIGAQIIKAACAKRL
jgi:hypothetical protein